MSDEWEDVPFRLRIRVQLTKFSFYLLGVGIRSFFFVLAAVCVMLVWDHHFAAIIGLVICLVLMWADSQEASEPKDWLKADQHILK